ncbi:nidogen-like domain-containing protein [Ditylenchus destructor]|nr:nidogen-like domain-containing protein [Ditylenchus destructor]
MCRLQHICIILCATLFCVTLAGVSLNDFFRFGEHYGDKETEGNDHPGRIDIEPPFKIFGKLRDYVNVGHYGWFSFAGGFAVIFNCHYENDQLGTTFHRISTDDVDLEEVQREISSAFPAFQDSKLKWAVIGTWKDNGHTSYPNDLNTFQGILTTDGVRSFAIYYYNTTNRIEKETWAGFKLTDNTVEYRYNIEGSKSNDMLTMEHRSNVGSPGKWVFRIDLPEIYGPSSICPKPPTPVNGFCNASEYAPGSEARCGCNLDFSPTSLDTLSLTCLPISYTYNWVGNIPVCRPLTQRNSPISITTQPTANSSHNISAPSLPAEMCPQVTCPPPPIPQNAICEEKAYVPGSAANCTCLPCYTLKNPSSDLYCSFAKDGSLFWHGEVPICALNYGT